MSDEIKTILFWGGSMSLGFVLAEAWHRYTTRKQRAIRSREALIAEFTDRQLWQFISLDEWLAGNQNRPEDAGGSE